MRLWTLVIAIGALAAPAAPAREPSPLLRHLLVVYNENNTYARELAYLYANVRDIPSDRILALRCPDRESVSRAQFRSEIEKPILDYIGEQGWIKWTSTSVNYFGVSYPVDIAVENDIWAIVLIRGIPLKIDGDPNEIPPPQISERFASNVASVDSELACLPVQGLPHAGMLPNRFFDAGTISPFDATWSRQMVLVTRLDAPLPGQVDSIIRDSLRAEREGLYGRAVFDARGILDKGYKLGDDWILESARVLEEAGYAPVLDRQEPVIPVHEPLDEVAIYAGWYTTHLDGFMKREDFRFRPGAVACHIHSFSAATLRFTDKNWVAPLLHKGAAAVMGSVAEPYLQFTPHLDRFFGALLEGYTFAEAAYFSQPGLSWMITMVGDPLYRPFGQGEAGLAGFSDDPRTQAWQRIHRAHLMRQAGKNFQDIREYLLKTPTALAWETLGDIAAALDRSPDEIFGAYYQALNLADAPPARVRIQLKKARYHRDRNRIPQALTEYESLVREHPLWPGIKDISMEAAQAALKSGLDQFPETIAAHYQEQKALEEIKAREEAKAREEKSKGGATPFPEAPQIKARTDLIPQKPTFAPAQPKADKDPGRLTEENDPTRLRPMPPPHGGP